MASEPPAPDVAELYRILERCVGTYQSCALSPQHAAALLQHMDTQAAHLEKLAAVEAERDQQTALVRRWDERDHEKTVQLARLAALEAAARRLAGHHGPVHCNCQACKQFRDAVAALDEMEKLAE